MRYLCIFIQKYAKEKILKTTNFGYRTEDWGRAGANKYTFLDEIQ
jgi:hypothetical protein